MRGRSNAKAGLMQYTKFSFGHHGLGNEFLLWPL